jgi:hypothetical protein
VDDMHGLQGADVIRTEHETPDRPGRALRL